MWKRRKHQRVTRRIIPDARDEAEPIAPSPAAEGDFIPIPLHNLRVDTVTSFNLHLWMSSNSTFVLYREGHLHFTEQHLRNLEQSGVNCVYISTADRPAYLRYMEQHLDAVVGDSSLSRTERSTILYACSAQLVDELFEDPESGPCLARARALVRSTVDHLLHDSDSLSSVMALMVADYELNTHATNTCMLGVVIGQRLGLCTRELRELGMGILLHDIGKTRIDAAILEKDSPLTDEEEAELRTHPDRGAEILEAHTEIPPSALAVVKQHHENCAGTGYPDGLHGREIHQYARIAALANTFDGLTSNRPSHRAFDSFPALRVMQDVMRDQFDPVLLRQLIRALASSVKPENPEDADQDGEDDKQQPAA